MDFGEAVFWRGLLDLFRLDAEALHGGDGVFAV